MVPAVVCAPADPGLHEEPTLTPAVSSETEGRWAPGRAVVTDGSVASSYFSGPEVLSMERGWSRPGEGSLSPGHCLSRPWPGQSCRLV